MNTLLPKFWTHGSDMRESSGIQETSSTCSVNVKYILKNSRNSGQAPLSAGDGLPALMMADQERRCVMQINFKFNIRVQEIENIILAQQKAAEIGDARSVLQLSKLLKKRLYKLDNFRFETYDEETYDPPNSCKNNVNNFGV